MRNIKIVLMLLIFGITKFESLQTSEKIFGPNGLAENLERFQKYYNSILAGQELGGSVEAVTAVLNYLKTNNNLRNNIKNIAYYRKALAQPNELFFYEKNVDTLKGDAALRELDRRIAEHESAIDKIVKGGQPTPEPESPTATAPEAPGAPEAPAAPGVPEAPSAPEAPGAPEAPAAPGEIPAAPGGLPTGPKPVPGKPKPVKPKPVVKISPIDEKELLQGGDLSPKNFTTTPEQLINAITSLEKKYSDLLNKPVKVGPRNIPIMPTFNQLNKYAHENLKFKMENPKQVEVIKERTRLLSSVFNSIIKIINEPEAQSNLAFGRAITTNTVFAPYLSEIGEGSVGGAGAGAAGGAAALNKEFEVVRNQITKLNLIVNTPDRLTELFTKSRTENKPTDPAKAAAWIKMHGNVEQATIKTVDVGAKSKYIQAVHEINNKLLKLESDLKLATAPNASAAAPSLKDVNERRAVLMKYIQGLVPEAPKGGKEYLKPTVLRIFAQGKDFFDEYK